MAKKMARNGKKSTAMKWLLIAGGVVFGMFAVCCGGIVWVYWALTAPTSFPAEIESYAQARKSFQTKLVRQSNAPQEFTNDATPPGVNEITYTSNGLALKAWVSAPTDSTSREPHRQSEPDAIANPADPRPGPTRERPSHSEPDAIANPADPRSGQPAVLFLHGGFAFGEGDWEQTAPFIEAGFVVMIPTLRGENGLPGSYSMFYNEVDDVIAAAEALAALPYVDKDRLYICGHSVGGTLSLLTAMSSDRFRAAASFGGSPDQVAWSRFQPELVPFDPKDQREYQMRSPLAFPGSFQCPVRIFYGDEEFLFATSSQKTAKLAKSKQRDVEAISIPGDHFTSVPAAINQAIAFFRQH